MSEPKHTMSAIVPCNDLKKSVAFYQRLGFAVTGDWGTYCILEDDRGASLHLTVAEQEWLIPNRNPLGLYLYAEDVDGLAAKFPGEILGKNKHPEDKEWGMYEFAVSDPDETLVRIGWPSRLRRR